MCRTDIRHSYELNCSSVNWAVSAMSSTYCAMAPFFCYKWGVEEDERKKTVERNNRKVAEKCEKRKIDLWILRSLRWKQKLYLICGRLLHWNFYQWWCVQNTIIWHQPSAISIPFHSGAVALCCFLNSVSCILPPNHTVQSCVRNEMIFWVAFSFLVALCILGSNYSLCETKNITYEKKSFINFRIRKNPPY